MGERLIVQEFREGVNKFISEVARPWMRDMFDKQQWTTVTLADRLNCDHSTVTRWLKGQREINPTTLCLITLVFRATAAQMRGVFTPPPQPNNDHAVVYGLAHAVCCEGQRSRRLAYTFGPFSYWLMRRMFEDKAWKMAVCKGERTAIDRQAGEVLATAQQLALKFPRLIDQEDEGGRLIQPDYPPPTDAQGLQDLFKKWYRSYERVVDVITLRPEGGANDRSQ